MGFEILISHSPTEFFMALAIGLLLKSNTEIASPDLNVLAHIGLLMSYYDDTDLGEHCPL